MDFTTFPEFDDHEQVMPITDASLGLRGFIAIHRTTLGPATGGTRYFSYASEEEAARDALGLSRTMTYKCALAGVPYGGGKGVLMADPQWPKTVAMMRAYARKVNELGGRFTTGEDVGITEEDLRAMQEESPFINGRPDRGGELGPWAARGVFEAIKAALEVVFGDSRMASRSFAIRGLGKVGGRLCRLIVGAGGTVYVADIDPEAVRRVVGQFPQVRVVGPGEIHRQTVDVYCPCAMGGEFGEQRISELRCRAICGAANNQLVSAEDGRRLHARGILYVPDYVANAGGLINIVAEMDPAGYRREWVLEKVNAIRGTARQVLDIAAHRNEPANEVADRLAEAVFSEKGV